MEWADVLKIFATLLGLAGTAYGVARFVLKERQKQVNLEKEVTRLEERNKLLASTVANNTVHYEELKELSSSAQLALAADLHSISLAVPIGSPTHLQIIISTDPDAEKILGKEFPVTKGISGKVFHSQKPEFINKATEHPKHFGLIDQTAGTKTGEGAILSFPLISGKNSQGIIQFMKSPGGIFSDEDVKIASRFINPISDMLSELVEKTEHDIPYGTRADEVLVGVCFTDINDYSKIRDGISLHQSVELLNEYYRRMINISAKYDAILEEYLGDGVYLSFRGENRASVAERAIKCSIELQKAFESLLDDWRAYEYPILENNYHNIGIAVGHVHEGLIGHPLQRRRKLIGKAVDTAAHLVEEGKKLGPCILVSEDTRGYVPGTDFKFSKFDEAEFECYEVEVKR